MLILSRRIGERIIVGKDIEIVVSRIKGDRVSIGVEAPKHIPVSREELESFESRTRDNVGRIH